MPVLNTMVPYTPACRQHMTQYQHHMGRRNPPIEVHAAGNSTLAHAANDVIQANPTTMVTSTVNQIKSVKRRQAG